MFVFQIIIKADLLSCENDEAHNPYYLYQLTKATYTRTQTSTLRFGNLDREAMGRKKWFRICSGTSHCHSHPRQPTLS